MSRLKLILIVMLIFSLPGLGLTEEAKEEKQEVEGQKAIELEKVVVTAPKEEMELEHVPGTTTVITEKELDVKNIHNAVKALEQIPGIYVRPGSSPMSGGSVNIRGVTENRTHVLLDGSRLNNSFYGGVNWGQIPVESIERIEVMPGPFSALYGGWGGLGGTIKVVTKMPEQQEFYAKGVYGSDNLRGGTLSYGNKFFNKLSVYLSFNHNETDGYLASGYRSGYKTKSAKSGEGDIPVTGWKRITNSKGDTIYLIGDGGDCPAREWSLLTKFRLDLPYDSKLTFTFWPSGSKSGYGRPKSYLRDAVTGEPVDSGNITFFDDGEQKKINLGTTFLGRTTYPCEEYRYTLDYDIKFLPNFSLKTTVDYVDMTNESLSISPGPGATSSGGSGSFSRSPAKRWQGRMEGNAMNLYGFNNLTFGVDYIGEYQKRSSWEVSDWRTKHSIKDFKGKLSGTNRIISFFVQDEMIVNSALTLYLGGRLDCWEVSDLKILGELSDTPITAPDRDETYFSPKFSIKYMPFELTTLRLSFAKAFTAPRLHDLCGRPPTATSVRLPSLYLKPEKATSWEAAADQRIGDKIIGRVTCFENRLRDLQYSERWRSEGISYRISKNAGKGKIRGVELGIDYQVTSFLKAYANMTYQDAKVIKNITEPETEGKRITSVPKEMYNFGFIVDYAGFKGSLTGRYVGKVYGDSMNRDKKNNVIGSYDPFFTIDMKVGYEVFRCIEFNIAADNLLDRDYYQGSANAPGRKFFCDITYRF